MKKFFPNKYIVLGGMIILLAVFIGVYFVKQKPKEDTKENFIEEENQVEEKNMFSDYEELAKQKLENLTLDEKIGALFLVRFPEKEAAELVQKYQFGGYILFEKDFRDKTEEEIKNQIQMVQEASKIPLLIAVDEEGGKLVRVSSNQKLREERFLSPRELYKLGGFEKIREDTLVKSEFLANLGINLNLAPVVDVSTDENDYIYARTLGEDTELTKIYAKTVIQASKEGTVSYTLKHFPGYGNNQDTHKAGSTDEKTYEEIQKRDLPPFAAGIEVGAEAVMISHNVVSSIDSENPASLSRKVNKVLRENLHFTGIIITDALDMGAVSKDNEAVIKAIEAGNDILIVTDYEKSIAQVKKAVEEGRITEEVIEERVQRILAWKYAKGLL